MDASSEKVLQTVRLHASQCPVFRATLFQSDAEVTRRVSLTPDKPGPHRVVVTGLPRSTKPNSVRIKPGPGCVIEDVVVERQGRREREKIETTMALDGRETERVRTPTDSEKTVLSSIESSALCLRRHESEKQCFGLRRSIMEAHLEAAFESGDVVGPDGHSEGTDAIAQSHLSEMLKLDATMGDTEEAIIAVQDKIRESVEEFNRIAPTSWKWTLPGDASSADIRLSVSNYLNGTVVVRREADCEPHQPRGDDAATILLQVTVNMPEVGFVSKPIQLEVTHLVEGVTWEPNYDIRYDSCSNEMELRYFGCVVQHSGEDWEAIALSLSTAKPHQPSAPRDLPTLEVRWAGPHCQWSRSRRGTSRAGGEGGLQDEAHSNMIKTTSAVVDSRSEQSTYGTVSVFKMGDSVTLKGDQLAQQLHIADLTLKTQEVLYAAPSASYQVFLRVKAVNTSSFVLMPCPSASVYIDGSYVTKTSFDFVPRGESFITTLGVDPGVKLQYNCRARRSEQGVISKTTIETIQNSTVITNLKSVPIRVLIVQDLPRSADSRIRVKMGANMVDASQIHKHAVTTDLDVWHEAAMGGGNQNEVLQNTSTNHIIFSRWVEPGKMDTVPFEYSLEWALNMPIISHDDLGDGQWEYAV